MSEAEKLFKKFSNLYQFEEGSPEYLLDAEDFKLALEEFVENSNKEKQVEVVEEKPVLVGHLNTPFGLKGYDRAEIGHPVFEYKDRYYIHLFNGPTSLPENKVTFYKETLKPNINFI